MHELSIAQSILEMARREVEASTDIGRLKEIGLRIGALSGVLPDALDFCFEAITEDTPLADCRLVIEPLGIVARCHDCQDSFEVEQFLFACPACTSGSVEVTQGYELEISYLEVEDEAPPAHEPKMNGVDYVHQDPG